MEKQEVSWEDQIEKDDYGFDFHINGTNFEDLTGKHTALNQS